MIVHITRKEHFNAAHKLWNPDWSEEKNFEVFGACANKNWHGHNFELFVTVKGEPDKTTGFVLDLKKLSKSINLLVIDKIDHKNLNVDVDFMIGKMASCENLVYEMWQILAPEVDKLSNGRGRLYCLKLVETKNNYVEYYGE